MRPQRMMERNATEELTIKRLKIENRACNARKGIPQGAPLWGADGGGSARKGAEGGGQGERGARGHLPASTRGGVKAPRQHRGRDYEPRAERRRIRKRMAMRVEHSRETALLSL